jgi:hypothetical protein
VPPVKVLYVLGEARSGSTILGSILGAIPGFFHAGELRFLWSRGLIQGWPCGCGRPVPECEVWAPAAEEVLGGRDPREVLDWQRQVLRLRHLERLLRSTGGEWAPRDRLAEVTAAVYRAVARRTGARVVVDSSKDPAYAALLGPRQDVDLACAHLIRDSRAVAFSLARRRLRRGGREMPRRPASRAAGSWLVTNLAAGRVRRRLGSGRSVVLRYEDLLARPRDAVASLLRLVGEAGDPPFVGERAVQLGVQHTVSGNPGRFRRGEIGLHADEEWRTAQRGRDRVLVTAVTLPLLSRYGYPLRVSATGRYGLQ